MTVIAWDGKTLAADKRSLNNRRPSTVTKIFRFGGALIGLTGDFARGTELLDWYRSGAQPETLPAFQRTDADYVPMLVVKQKGVFLFEQSPIPFLVEEPYFAIGSGRDYALMALHLGLSARRAVEETCKLTTCCGNGVDTLTLGDAE